MEGTNLEGTNLEGNVLPTDEVKDNIPADRKMYYTMVTEAWRKDPDQLKRTVDLMISNRRPHSTMRYNQDGSIGYDMWLS